MSDQLKTIAEKLVAGGVDEVTRLIEGALQSGAEAETIMNEALLAGMETVGQRFKDGDMFIPEVLRSAKAIAALIKLTPLLCVFWFAYRLRVRLLVSFLVGLIVFGNAPFVQVPFTQDLEACRLLLEETAPRMAGPKTAFGDAIGLGITLFERSEVEDRVMIALTDGNDTGSKVPPGEAAKIARDNDIIIHVVGVGDPAAVGEEKLDEEALQTVASTTSGTYYFAGDSERLQEIYAELDKMSSREIETEPYRPRIDLYYLPLAAFVVLSMLFYGIRFFAMGSGREQEGKHD